MDLLKSNGFQQQQQQMSNLLTWTEGAMTAAPSSSNGHQQDHLPAQRTMNVASTDADPATPLHPADEPATASDAAKMDLIVRGKLLVERYQRHKASGDSLLLDHHHSDYEQQHVQPPPQFYSDISLLSSTSSGGAFQILQQYNGMGANGGPGKQQQLLYQSDGSKNFNSSSESLVDLNALLFSVDPAVEPNQLGSWSEFLAVQLQSAQLLDTMDEQLERLTEFVRDEFQTESFVLQLCRSVRQLVQQKRAAEAAIEKFTKEIGPPVVMETDDTEVVKGDNTAAITGGEGDPVPLLEARHSNSKTKKKALKWLSRAQFRELVDDETAELQRELDESKLFIDELKTKVHTLRTEATQDTGRSSSESDDEARRLENRLQEKEELLVSLRTAIEQLGAEQSQLEKAAADKETLLKRAHTAKVKQLDQLLHDVELPAPWRQVADENGIVYFRQSDRACAPQLEDPRVPLALSLYGIGAMKKRASSSSSPRSASGRTEQIQWEEKKAGRTLSSGGSQYSRHDSVDLTGCEDISVPPDDGCKHKIDDFATPLPDGWEMRATAAGSVFFVNRHTNVTTWKDPREEEDGDGNDANGNGNGKKAHDGRRVEELRVKIPSERKQKDQFASGNENTVTSNSPLGFPQEDGVQYFDVVFKERGPIGIHFQANNPDAGATVRRLLPGTAAIETGILRPFDCLVAVNQHPVDTASFRHVMILLQGGLRPLTLTFKRDLNADRRTSGPSATGRDGQGLDADLDEEVVLDSEMDQDHRDGTATTEYGERRRSSKGLLSRRHSNQDVAAGGRHANQQHQDVASQPQNAPTRAASGSTEHEEDSVADKIITNLFSFFWTAPEPVTGEVQTV